MIGEDEMTMNDDGKSGWGVLWILDLVVAFVLILLLGVGPALAMFLAHSLLKRGIGYPLSLILSVGIGFLTYFLIVAVLIPQSLGV